MQVLLLPKLALHLIAEMVALFPGPFFLRECSKSWKLICNTVIPSVSIDAHHLPAILRFVRLLTCLKKLRINGYNSETATTLEVNALSPLPLELTEVELFAGYEISPGQLHLAHPLRIADLSSLLLPFSRTLSCLRMVNCQLFRCESLQLSSPGFFSRFPCLQELQFEHITANPALTALDMSGCTQLQLLDCRNCSLLTLNVKACKALTALDFSENCLTEIDISACVAIQLLSCTGNKLRALDVSACAGSVTDLHCYSNQLSTLDLSACTKLHFMHCHNNCISTLDLSGSAGLKDIDVRINRLQTIRFSELAELDKVICFQNPPGLVLSGSAKLSNLECDANFTSLSLATRSQLSRLVLATAASGSLEGFEKIRYLALVFDAGSAASLDLTGCAEGTVEMDCTSMVEHFSFRGRSTVWKLTMFRGCWNDLHGFTNLTELHYHVDGLRAMDLSDCTRLRKVYLSELSHHSFLTAIDLTGCAVLEELHCENFLQLAKLDISQCVGLKVLKCTGSGIKSLDVSCCPLLTSLDVSRSGWLRALCIKKCTKLVHIVSKDFSNMHIT